MNVSFETMPSSLVVRLSGRLTFRDGDAFQSIIYDLKAAGKPWVRLDLRDLEYLDSYGIGLIILARDAAQECGAHLELTDARPAVAEILDRMAFERFDSGAGTGEDLRIVPPKRVGEDLRIALAGSFRLKDQERFLPIISDAVGGDFRHLILDMGELRFIDSIGISLVMTAADEARKRGKELVLAYPHGGVRELLRLTAIDSVLRVIEI